MTVHVAQLKALDTGLICLSIVAGVRGISINVGDLAHKLALGAGVAGAEDVIRAAKIVGLKARIVSKRQARLDRLTYPVIVEMKDGGFAVLGGVKTQQVLLLRPPNEAPEVLDIADFETFWTGRIILAATRFNPAALDGVFDLRWFLSAIRKYKGIFSEVLLASFILQLLALVTPMFFQVVVDKVLVHRTLNTLEILGLGIVLVALFEFILGTLRTHVLSHTTNRIDVELGARLYDHLLALPMSYFGVRRVGDSVSRVRELEHIRDFLTGSALTVVLDLFFTGIFIAVMFWYSATLTWIVLASFPVFIAISAIASPIFHRRLNEKFNLGAENQSFLVESVTGIETLKAMAVEPQMRQKWDEQLAAYVTASFRVLKLANVASQLVQLTSKICLAAVLFYGAWEVIEGRLTIGELVAINMLTSRVIDPVLRLAQIWQDFQQTRISAQRLGDILNTPREVSTNAISRSSLPDIQGEIRFDDVSFRYRPDGQLILTDITLTIPPGQVIGVVGASGSGKSTLAKLVQRMYVPAKGRILIDGIDLHLVDTAWLRRQIGIVLQENVLFNRSVRDNIALADPAMDMNGVIHASTLAGAHAFILELPEGYDTIIGERGASLSGGQRQRIAIARALATNPRILIFDEATSALDYESEHIIQENMRQIVSGRTVLIIAHRLSTVRGADRIITVENGRIVEDGSHDDLVRLNGRYAKLHRLQGGMV